MENRSEAGWPPVNQSRPTGCVWAAELSLTHGEDKFPWLKPGDKVEVTVEGLGTLRNEIVAGPPLYPLR